MLNINCLQYMKFVNNHKIQMVYFSYRSPIILRSFSFVLVRDRFSFVLDRFSFGSRSSSVHSPFILRSFSVRESKIDRRTNGESSEARRRCIETLMGGEGKDDPNILVLQNAFEKTRKQMKVNALSFNALSDNLNFPMFAHRCAQMAHSMCKPKPRCRSFLR